jgi:hypothetical protein
LRDDVPFDDDSANARKAERIRRAFGVLRERLAAVRADVLVIIGNDQRELFDFSNYPAIALLACAELEGILVHDASAPYEDAERARFPGHPAFAATLLAGLMERSFDPAFALDMPAAGHGLPHAIMNPMRSLTDFTTPIVPLMLNCYYAPQVTAERSYALGRALAEIIASDPSELRVAVIGSGGLWHTPGEQRVYIDEAFDATLLSHMERGAIHAMARHFDDYRIRDDDPSQQAAPRGARSEALRAVGFEYTGLPLPRGPQGGTRETCCWIAAAAVVDGLPATVVDYVPIYASPIGVGFAYWDLTGSAADA